MKLFFCGICGSGMSALSQISLLEGNEIYGSDRSFDKGENKELKEKFEKLGIKIYPQDGSGIKDNIDFLVISTAVEKTNPDIKIAEKKKIRIIHRSELLNEYVKKYKTIAVGGTSGKSTTTAMIWHILKKAGLDPSVINGAYINLIKDDKLIGNAYLGNGDILVIEADESDASITKYKPYIGVLLNISKDHKDVVELKKIFSEFLKNSNIIVVNRDDKNAYEISLEFKNKIYFSSKNIRINGKSIEKTVFEFENETYEIPLAGKHNIENAFVAAKTAEIFGINLKDGLRFLSDFKGIYRRMNIIGKCSNITIIDDYAHNPAKIMALIKTLIENSKKFILIYQPHGFYPTKLLKNELIETFKNIRDDDMLIFPEIYYAGGSVNKDISSKELVDEIKKYRKKVLYFENRNEIINYIIEIKNLSDYDIIAISGARDNTLNDFAKEIYTKLKNILR
jgi:UDP-N-acetylmuramate--alanine ligase